MSELLSEIAERITEDAELLLKLTKAREDLEEIPAVAENRYSIPDDITDNLRQKEIEVSKNMIKELKEIIT